MTRPLPRPEGVVVRGALPDDATSVWRLVAAFATSFVPARASFDASFVSLLADDAALLLVAEAGDDVVGYLVAHRHATLFANAPVVWVEEVMVDDAARRRGTGRLLMGVVEEWAAGAGAAYVALATRRAAPFYEALGYDESATFFRKTLPPR
ncbi:GNAT family N-acetyltransferase [Cellulosimicrobium cellulans]|uniref:GNAT family N-acetyltransferase n=1 Tax=Cellulosimicrobium cellulans TaxID=1710 RepID=UPI001883BB43|nr:GNAT family N-acetyltransferase [Cellulosimicrobium cellulans]MBE9937900.1 GNAT family N-acetyltransferase [Cellulosimicrobium cellulans]